ncbi:Cell surface glycoprotein [Methanosarcina siciliae C2J]|uniref:Cell surface glycoprotein n=3 Tax=Methanosarcina siciliae TaxID=38027 RepID=A0A0E3LB16_9EURY|nr:DUF3344 domain-containing protein [Methanosarcina siciliae]AKB29114.1 Cell surface glycoprotein [Methanosarcina siciliae T4/M]AKB32986.1 Cell surface glycoprotein [Methanosarcina siciliae HI350]AKB36561.1 Cell surface glycoprotein [Methanosarcina siciliae C2J]
MQAGKVMQDGSIKRKGNRRLPCRIRKNPIINAGCKAKNRHFDRTEKNRCKNRCRDRKEKFGKVVNILPLTAGICLLITLFCGLMIPPALAQSPENNGYVADKPLEVYSHDTVQGDLIYTVGDSYYSGKVYPGDVYSVIHNVNLPEGATVKFARLYVYWTWSAEGITGRYPEMNLSFNGESLEPEREYSDRKGWGIYDYPTGTWAYDVSTYVPGSGTFKTDIENIGSGTPYVCFDGVGLLIVYTDPNGKYMEYWIGEGAEELNSQMDENGNPLYYASPNQTICEMLRPTLQFPVRSATLWTIIQSGNWEDNILLVNGNEFPGICNGKPYPDLDIDTREVKDYLKSGENSILFQAVGDYAVPSGSFLVVEKDSLTEEAQVDSQAEDVQASLEETSENPGTSDIENSGDETSGDKTENTPGFEFISTLVIITGGKLAAGHRKQKTRK